MDEYTVKDLKAKLTAHLMNIDLKAMSLDELKTYTETVDRINSMEKMDALGDMIKTMGDMNKSSIPFGFAHLDDVLNKIPNDYCCCTRAETEAHNNG